MRRGEILLDLRILDRWDSELERMNAGKEGGRYVYPDIFAKLLGYMHLLFHLPYRQTEGFLKALRRFDSRIHVPDYSTIDRRVNRLDVKLDEEDYGDDVILAVDARRRIKVSNRGDWMRREWKRRRGYLKVHIAVDTKRKRILALEVTDERVGDARLPMADGTLRVVPRSNIDDHMMRALLPLSDVLSTGHHAAVCAEVACGSTVAVIGDGAVGLCAVAASKRLGASRIFLISTHEDPRKDRREIRGDRDHLGAG